MKLENITSMYISMKRSIIKPSNSFKRNCLKKNAIISSVDSFLYQVNSAIESANKSNKNKTALRLPSSFSIPEGIDYNNFRIEVYYNIVKILETKGYKVKIKSDISSIGDRNTSYGDNNVLYIQWKIDEDFAREEMIKKLSDITI
jgi:hypothetical protein